MKSLTKIYKWVIFKYFLFFSFPGVFKSWLPNSNTYKNFFLRFYKQFQQIHSWKRFVSVFQKYIAQILGKEQQDYRILRLSVFK